MSEPDSARLHAVVEGRVQGVGFRAFVVQKANDLGLTGWVRNRWDDTVELVAEGERNALDRLLAALHQGPRSAYVTHVATEWQTPTAEFTYFSVRSTV